MHDLKLAMFDFRFYTLMIWKIYRINAMQITDFHVLATSHITDVVENVAKMCRFHASA